MNTDDARHLLMRTGIGAAPADVVNLQGKSRQQGVDIIVQGMSDQPDVAMPDWVNQPLPHYHARADMDSESRARFNNERDAELAQLRQWWVLNMLESSSPQTERLVLFWHDLFATNYQDLNKQSLAMARQNQTFREMGFGSWEHLLKAMIRDAALLEFLNSGTNRKSSPNENLARELMELFVLGEGNYDEATVREAARALTGYGTSSTHDLQFRLMTWVQDREDKQLFGGTGPFDGDDLVELLLEQKAAPVFLATRFWHAFVSDTPPDALWLNEQAEKFQQSDFDIPTLYRNVLQSEAFWVDDNRGAIIKSPVDLLVGTARTLNYPKSQWQRIPNWQSRIGMQLFAPPNVAGWNEGGAFITPGHLLNRYKVVRQMTQRAARDAKLADAGMSSSKSDMQTMQQGNGMTMQVEAGMQSQPDMNTLSSDESVVINLRLAAEDYRGPAHYNLSLIHGEKTLWRSPSTRFMAGRDTVQQGRIENVSDASWERVYVSVPSHYLAQATAVRVHFLNDDAGADGDRNLYVDGIQLGSQWLSASQGIQTSDCAPELRANAGRLYCAGYVEIAVNNPDKVAATDAQGDKSGDQIVASDIHIGWGAHNLRNGKYSLEVILDHLQTPEKRFHQMRFMLEKQMDEPMVLQLDSFACWPDCIETWPDCAWVDDNFKAAMHVNLPWAVQDDVRWSVQYDHQCQYDGLNNDERRLVSTLWQQLPDMLALVKRTTRVQNNTERWLPIIDFFLDEFHNGSVSFEDTPYDGNALPLVIAPRYVPAEQTRLSLVPPVTDVANVRELVSALEVRQLQLHQLLLPALTGDKLPPLPESDAKRPERYLKAVIENPLFQLK